MIFLSFRSVSIVDFNHNGIIPVIRNGMRGIILWYITFYIEISRSQNSKNPNCQKKGTQRRLLKFSRVEKECVGGVVDDKDG